MRLPTILLALLALTVPATAAAATPRFLPPVKHTLTAKKAAERTCAARLLSDRTRGIERRSYRAPMSGFLNVRLKGRRAGNWDVAVFDASTKRALAA